MTTENAVPIRWEEYISFNPQILRGKPAITGTRLSVEFILEVLAGGHPIEEILEDWPGLTRDQVRACMVYALDAVREERYVIYRQTE